MLGHDLANYQQELKKMLSCIADALEKKNVPYQLGYGTLLGALRHKDVIPWDDDVDITIPRRNYSEALTVIRKLCPEYFVWDWDRDVKCDCDFARVFTRIRAGQSIEEYRAYIDIYPLESAPSWKLFRLVNRCLFIAIRRLINRKSGAKLLYRRYTISNCIFYLLALPFSWMSISQLKRLYVIFRMSGRESGFVWYDDRHVIPSYWFDGDRRGWIGGRLYRVPQNAENVLETEYGDWRQLPPVGQRGEHAYTNSGGELVTKPDDEMRR